MFPEHKENGFAMILAIFMLLILFLMTVLMASTALVLAQTSSALSVTQNKRTVAEYAINMAVYAGNTEAGNVLEAHRGEGNKVSGSMKYGSATYTWEWWSVRTVVTSGEAVGYWVYGRAYDVNDKSDYTTLRALVSSTTVKSIDIPKGSNKDTTPTYALTSKAPWQFPITGLSNVEISGNLYAQDSSQSLSKSGLTRTGLIIASNSNIIYNISDFYLGSVPRASLTTTTSGCTTTSSKICDSPSYRGYSISLSSLTSTIDDNCGADTPVALPSSGMTVPSSGSCVGYMRAENGTINIDTTLYTAENPYTIYVNGDLGMSSVDINVTGDPAALRFIVKGDVYIINSEVNAYIATIGNISVTDGSTVFGALAGNTVVTKSGTTLIADLNSVNVGVDITSNTTVWTKTYVEEVTS